MWHLIHPVMVHFTVAFLLVGAVGEACGLLRSREGLAGVCSRLTLIGTLSLLPTIVSGVLAVNTFDVRPSASGVLDLHEAGAVATVIVFVGLHFWKGWVGGTLSAGQQKGYAWLLLFGAALVVYGALLGGELTYFNGAGVILD